MKLEIEMTATILEITRIDDEGKSWPVYKTDTFVNPELAIQLLHQEIMRYAQKKMIELRQKEREGEKHD